MRRAVPQPLGVELRRDRTETEPLPAPRFSMQFPHATQHCILTRMCAVWLPSFASSGQPGLRKRAAGSFETMADFSNWLTAPSTWRMSTRVGSSSAAVRPAAESAATTRTPKSRNSVRESPRKRAGPARADQRARRVRGARRSIRCAGSARRGLHGHPGRACCSHLRRGTRRPPRRRVCASSARSNRAGAGSRRLRSIRGDASRWRTPRAVRGVSRFPEPDHLGYAGVLQY